MPRSATDATRFTATGPYAYSKTNASTIQLSQPPPSNETPAQKVIRLRAAAQRAKLGQETTWDRVVERGKVWADRAHRVTALSLVGLTGMYLSCHYLVIEIAVRVTLELIAVPYM